MLFESESLSFELLDVLRIAQEQVSMFNTGRNFDAISFRLSTDARLKTETQDPARGRGDLLRSRAPRLCAHGVTR